MAEPSGDLEPCKRCEEFIDPSVSICPECGNNPQKKAKWSAGVLIAIGVVIVLLNPLIGAPIFLIGIFGYIAVRSAHYSPTDHDF